MRAPASSKRISHLLTPHPTSKRGVSCSALEGRSLSTSFRKGITGSKCRPRRKPGVAAHPGGRQTLLWSESFQHSSFAGSSLLYRRFRAFFSFRITCESRLRRGEVYCWDGACYRAFTPNENNDANTVFLCIKDLI